MLPTALPRSSKKNAPGGRKLIACVASPPSLTSLSLPRHKNGDTSPLECASTMHDCQPRPKWFPGSCDGSSKNTRVNLREGGNPAEDRPPSLSTIVPLSRPTNTHAIIQTNRRKSAQDGVQPKNSNGNFDYNIPGCSTAHVGAMYIPKSSDISSVEPRRRQSTPLPPGGNVSLSALLSLQRAQKLQGNLVNMDEFEEEEDLASHGYLPGNPVSSGSSRKTKKEESTQKPERYSPQGSSCRNDYGSPLAEKRLFLSSDAFDPQAQVRPAKKEAHWPSDNEHSNQHDYNIHTPMTPLSVRSPLGHDSSVLGLPGSGEDEEHEPLMVPQGGRYDVTKFSSQATSMVQAYGVPHMSTMEPACTPQQSVSAGRGEGEERDCEEDEDESVDEEDDGGNDEAKVNAQFYGRATTAENHNGAKFLNDYLIISDIGHGASGKVKLAYSLARNQSVAIKVITRRKEKKYRLIRSESMVDAGAGDGGSEQRPVVLSPAERQKQALQREIDVMKHLHHSNIVSLYEVINDPQSNKIYLIMQYIDKGPIATINSDGSIDKPIDPVDMIGIASQVCAGLRYLHHRGVVHRDIKPENILVDTSGHAFLADFGVAEMFKDEDAKATTVDTCEFQGTPLFMAPEIYYVDDDTAFDANENMSDDDDDEGGRERERTPAGVTDTDKSSSCCGGGKPPSSTYGGSTGGGGKRVIDLFALDIWALGVTFVTLLAGHVPFLSINDIRATVKKEVTLPVEVPHMWRELLSMMLESNPDRRPHIRKVQRVLRRLERHALKKELESTTLTDTTDLMPRRSVERSARFRPLHCNFGGGNHGECDDDADGGLPSIDDEVFSQRSRPVGTCSRSSSQAHSSGTPLGYISPRSPSSQVLRLRAMGSGPNTTTGAAAARGVHGVLNGRHLLCTSPVESSTSPTARLNRQMSPLLRLPVINARGGGSSSSGVLPIFTQTEGALGLGRSGHKSLLLRDAMLEKIEP